MWWKIAGIAGALGVACGAFGAHALQGVVTSDKLLHAWEVGARYHLLHALALLAVALHPKPPNIAGGLFVAGILLFSGSLYTMTLTGQSWLGAITPFGGVCFILGWLSLAFSSRM